MTFHRWTLCNVKLKIEETDSDNGFILTITNYYGKLLLEQECTGFDEVRDNLIDWLNDNVAPKEN